MRLIGTLENESQVTAFSHFLQDKNIPHQIEIQKNTDWGSTSYGVNHFQIWIYEEDQLDKVLNWFHLFIENPQNPLFNFPKSAPLELTSKPLFPPSLSPPSSPSSQAWNRQLMGWVTRALLAVCCLLFLLSQVWTSSQSIPERYSALMLFTSPVEKHLLYDYPQFYELLDRFLYLYGYTELEHPEALPPDVQQLWQKIKQTPFWPGFYFIFLKEGWQATIKAFNHYPTFEKIREGQVWRLFTPCLLHADLFHLFFNMLWLIVLGKQIEQRLKPWRYGLFILILGIFSNTAQYLMSGPNFIGFSGILCGMLAFIWMRQKWAAWEGYQIDRLTLVFMLIFIIGMALIQTLSFFLEKSFDLSFSPNIANMAHLAGGLMGFLLGRLNFFRWRHA